MKIRVISSLVNEVNKAFEVHTEFLGFKTHLF